MMQFMNIPLILAVSLSALYATLDPTSVSQHFAFYELYPKTAEGKEALKHAWELLSGNNPIAEPELILPSTDLQPILSLVNRSSETKIAELDADSLAVIGKLSQHLGNRKLKGHSAWTVKEVVSLSAEETDLARALLVTELGDGEEKKRKIQSYEAHLDLMALQIQARLKPGASPLEKVRAINDYIFSEMRFRFPPHSLYAKEIDVYTFLPSVLDSRRGVCLGVSILYLSLAQRLDLSLEAITPPGHIYVRYVDPQGEETNIETTNRGIDVPSEHYLGIETRKLQKRTIKEVVGLAFMNQAAVSWHHKNPKTAITLYEKAVPFLEEDPLLKLFLAFNYLFVGEEKKGRSLLKEIKDIVPDHMISKDTIIDDYLAGLCDASAIEAVFSEVDERRSSILDKQQKLKEVISKFPRFRQGIFHLAVTYLQLGREKEALPYLMRCAQLCPDDATVHYYLAAIQFQRRRFNEAWKSLRLSENIVFQKNHHPRALLELRQALQQACPETRSLTL